MNVDIHRGRPTSAAAILVLKKGNPMHSRMTCFAVMCPFLALPLAFLTGCDRDGSGERVWSNDEVETLIGIETTFTYASFVNSIVDEIKNHPEDWPERETNLLVMELVYLLDADELMTRIQDDRHGTLRMHGHNALSTLGVETVDELRAKVADSQNTFPKYKAYLLDENHEEYERMEKFVISALDFSLPGELGRQPEQDVRADSEP